MHTNETWVLHPWKQRTVPSCFAQDWGLWEYQNITGVHINDPKICGGSIWALQLAFLKSMQTNRKRSRRGGTKPPNITAKRF